MIATCWLTMTCFFLLAPWEVTGQYSILRDHPRVGDGIIFSTGGQFDRADGNVVEPVLYPAVE